MVSRVSVTLATRAPRVRKWSVTVTRLRVTTGPRASLRTRPTSASVQWVSRETIVKHVSFIKTEI